MISHVDLGNSSFRRIRRLIILISNGEVQLAGNSKLKIYGKLNCASGKRMKPINRVFFRSVSEAEDMGYRPCGHCMREAYHQWKDNKMDYTEL